MRFRIALFASFSAALTIALIAAAVIEGREYQSFLADAPGRASAAARSGRSALGSGLEALAYRLRNRKSALLRERIISASNRVFAASPDLAREFEPLRRFAADGLENHEDWILVDSNGHGLWWGAGSGGVVMGPEALELPPLDEARAFWQQLQRLQDARDRIALNARLGRPGSPALPVSHESELRAHQVGCGFHEAGIRAGLRHSASDAASISCAPAVFIDCQPSAAENVVSGVPGGGDGGLEWDCLELERGRRGAPVSLEGFAASWTPADCLREARRVVSAPDWRGRKQRCPWVQ
jgi:hypothetical protein